MLRHLFLASRPVSWINTAYPFAAAYLITTREVDVPFVLGTLYFFVPYNLALYGINDVFDHASDAANPRKGGVHGALLPPTTHRAVLVAAAATNLPFLVALVVLGTWPSSLVLAVSVAALLAYSVPGLRFKEVPGLDSLTSSLHFVTPAVFGLALAGATPTGGVGAVLGAFLLWGMASHAFGAVQDVAADRAGGIASVATVLGARTTVRLALAAWVCAGLLVLAAPWPAPLAAALVVPYLIICAPYRNVTEEGAAATTRAWRHFLAVNYGVGFAVTMLFIAAW